jgi:hypothetical protein
MPTSVLNAPPATIETAVSATIECINASAIDLVAKRAEIDSRIRRLQQVVRGLRYLEARKAFDTRYAQPVDSDPSDADPSEEPPVRRNPRRSRDGGAMTALARACRIALMEAESAAPLEEIQARIVRRGSFLFSDSESFAETIICTLNAMTDHDELRRFKNGGQLLWQRIVTARPVTSLRDRSKKHSRAHPFPDGASVLQEKIFCPTTHFRETNTR